MIQLNLFETSIIKSDHLVADTPRQAYYKVWLESLMGKYLVRKESGTKKHTLDKRIWKFDDFVQAEKFYIRKVKEKTNQNRKSKRKYDFAAKKIEHKKSQSSGKRKPDHC